MRHAPRFAPRLPLWIGSIAGLLCAATAQAGETPAPLTIHPTRIDTAATHAPQQQASTPDDDGPARERVLSYGQQGSTWLTLGGGAAYDFEGSTDSNLHVAWSRFLAQDVEFALEAGGWYYNQPGDNTGGISGVFLFRWHFVNTGDWTLYADAGIGLLGAFDEVPDGGTSFNFQPRAGVGVTRRIADDDTRLQVGLRWHHISNARIQGDEDNPSRDAPMLYAGIVIPL